VSGFAPQFCSAASKNLPENCRSIAWPGIELSKKLFSDVAAAGWGQHYFGALIT
jgi:hypothetical protein